MLSASSLWYVNIGITVVILAVVVVLRLGNAALTRKLKGDNAQVQALGNTPPVYYENQGGGYDNELVSKDTDDNDSEANFNDFMKSLK